MKNKYLLTIVLDAKTVQHYNIIVESENDLLINENKQKLIDALCHNTRYDKFRDDFVLTPFSKVDVFSFTETQKQISVSAWELLRL